MRLEGKNILFICQFSAPYKGNFIASFEALEYKLCTDYNCFVAWVFPESVKKRDWFASFTKEHTCYTTCNEVSQSVDEIANIIKLTNVDLVHCNFDGYDIPVSKACKKVKNVLNKRIVQVWHLHDAMYYLSDLPRKILQAFIFFKHYGWYGKNVNIIGVSNEILNFIKPYRYMFRSNSQKESLIPNGIVEGRLLMGGVKKKHDKFTFLAFGGRNIHKRIDLIISAAMWLYDNASIDFQVLITKGTDTLDVVHRMFPNGNIPKWLKLIDQTSNINVLYGMADCFISSSVAETFSYAVCEATICGLPVIQSDIEGTIWNADNPSTLLFKSENVEDLADCMLRMYKADVKDLNTKCEITKQNNIRRFGINVWTTDIIKFYKALK